MSFNTPKSFLEAIGVSGTKRSLKKEGWECDGLENDLNFKTRPKTNIESHLFNDFRVEMKFL